MKAIEAFQIAVYKKSLSQIDFINEMVRAKAAQGKFNALIRFEPTEQTKEHLKKNGYSMSFPTLETSNNFEFLVSWDLKQNTNEP